MTKTCSNCGTDNRDDAKFCMGCGQSLANAGAGSQGLEMAEFSCAACGHVNRAEARFCAKCGAQLVLAAPPPRAATLSWVPYLTEVAEGETYDKSLFDFLVFFLYVGGGFAMLSAISRATQRRTAVDIRPWTNSVRDERRRS